MKKILVLSALLFSIISVQAQETPSLINAQLIHDINAGVTIFIFFLSFVLFIITLIKMNLDYRLKNKMIEKGVSEKLAEQFLKPVSNDVKSTSVKWFMLLGGISLGFYLVYLSQPVGLHSIAIITFCLSLGFLGFYFYLKRTNA